MAYLHGLSFNRERSEENEQFWQSVYDLISNRVNGSYDDVKNKFYNEVNTIVNKLSHVEQYNNILQTTFLIRSTAHLEFVSNRDQLVLGVRNDCVTVYIEVDYVD